MRFALFFLPEVLVFFLSEKGRESRVTGFIKYSRNTLGQLGWVSLGLITLASYQLNQALKTLKKRARAEGLLAALLPWNWDVTSTTKEIMIMATQKQIIATSLICLTVGGLGGVAVNEELKKDNFVSGNQTLTSQKTKKRTEQFSKSKVETTSNHREEEVLSLKKSLKSKELIISKIENEVESLKSRNAVLFNANTELKKKLGNLTKLSRDIKAKVRDVDQKSKTISPFSDVTKKISPFTGIKFEKDNIIVRLEGKWYVLASINNVSGEDILKYAKKEYGKKWDERIAEDLVVVLEAMKTEISHEEVDLVLKDLESGYEDYKYGIKMTKENRKKVKDYFNK